ncbi:C2 NT-type domain-containing protein [Favolaschia claudopus]|uniref:C2 NT-type domain-containing protein n=1 Tax=Favolaschia claudopus TaxID=2862362 RepID=A0AAW0CUJ7_9AGAR
MPTPTDTAAPSTGLKAQLLHLVPRHARFEATVHIIQLESVPLVRGDFSVRWRWKNTQKVKGKNKEQLTPEVGLEDGGGGDADSFGSSTEEPLPPGSQSTSTASSSAVNANEDFTHARTGQTAFLPLHEHAVTYDLALTAVVQMSIDRDTMRLLPHPFKLSILQRDAPHHNLCLGTVELDLAKYADSSPAPSGGLKGTVTRRYLLHNSKTNATLRLSVRVAPLESAPAPVPFVAPPLPADEILAGVNLGTAALLTEREEVLRTRPSALDLYAPISVPANAGGGSLSADAPAPFDLRTLPLAQGPLPTAALIDALFNPALVSDARLVSPFTRFVPAEELLLTSHSAPSIAESSSSNEGPPSMDFLALDPSPQSGSRWWRPRSASNRSRSRSRSRVRTGVGVAAMGAVAVAVGAAGA